MESTMNKRRKSNPRSVDIFSPSETSSPAESVANNFDLLTEILLRVPAKSTIRFKCVSKHWLSLLSDSLFATNHTIRNPRPSISGLFFYIRGILNYVPLHGWRRNLPSFSVLEKPSKIRVAHSCNGLLLCYSSHFNKRKYIVCNLTTKKFAILPEHDASVYGPGGCLAFDPSKSPDHYKVVSFADDPYHIDVYSSQSLCWKRVSLNQKFVRHAVFHAVFWNGAIHCLTKDNCLLRFDVDAEEMVAMPNPQSPKILPVDKIRYFGQCGDGLILIQCRARFPSGFRILELERDYSGWNVKCRVNLRPLISEFPEMITRSSYNIFKVLCAVKGETERDFALVLAIPGRVVSYYVKHKTWDVIQNLPPSESIEYGYIGLDDCVYPFIENLFPVFSF